MAEIIEKVEDYVTRESFSHEMLMDKLSEFLAVEKGGVQLYEAALRVVQNEEVRNKFREFLAQTRKHEEILTRVINQLGGNPSEMSASAKIAEKKAKALLETMDASNGKIALSPKEAEINAMENILLAETKDHADWELLGKVVRRTDDHKLSDILQPAVNEVEPEEDEHLTWTKEQMAKMAIESMGRQSR
jgi:rubrerythrin